MSSRPEGNFTERYIVRVGETFAWMRAKTDKECARGHMEEERAFWIAFGAATGNLDFAARV